MTVVKRIVCLANSRKLSGRCIAGIELVNGARVGWIRPVSAREHEEVSEYERQFEDGSDPQVLDIIDVPLLGPRPKDFQRENWLLDPDSYWRRADRLGWDDLSTLADRVERLWDVGLSENNQRTDRVAEDQLPGIPNSLRLIHTSNVKMTVCSPGAAFGNPKRRVQGHFVHAGVDYRLWITDPNCERAYLAKADGEYSIGESYITVSLGEPYEGFAYKLIAAIMERAGVPKQ
ncbi:MAG: hypothetical protein KGJ62_06740 [Armatimonadetes bacterium]|nr:hypothetical protein [Armatimonadota bacterium]MDE2207402.1 hypothetical protein [Armatimonadota bacterium]